MTEINIPYAEDQVYYAVGGHYDPEEFGEAVAAFMDLTIGESVLNNPSEFVLEDVCWAEGVQYSWVVENDHGNDEGTFRHVPKGTPEARPITYIELD